MGEIPSVKGAAVTASAALFSLTDEQRALVVLCRDFAAREIRPIARAIDEADTAVPWDVWYAAAGAGITAFMIDEAYGGGGITDCLTACLVQEELCHGDAGIGNLLTSGGFFAAPRAFLLPLCVLRSRRCSVLDPLPL
jgi:alkylation response protein AidB-like acyl-CoA dehydrogenase